MKSEYQNIRTEKYAPVLCSDHIYRLSCISRKCSWSSVPCWLSHQGVQNPVHCLLPHHVGQDGAGQPRTDPGHRMAMAKVTEERTKKRERKGKRWAGGSESRRWRTTGKGGSGLWENRVLPWQQRATHKVNQASPPHLSSNLDVGQRHKERKQGLVSSEDNLRTSDRLIIICTRHSEATY